VSALFLDGFRLMREQLAVYAILALACAAAAWLVFPRVDLYDIVANRPFALVSTPPVSVALGLALVAIFYILPSAMRRIEPGFRMTRTRVVVAIAVLFGVGAVTELGYAFAIVPGIVAAVLLSQALVGALLRIGAEAGFADVVPTLLGSVKVSILMTRAHFATTLGVIVASLAILLVPFTLVMLTLVVLGARVPPSLVLTTPILFLTFIYFECVRYALIVRWYRRLEGDVRV
jgi:hypothetical protein